MNTFYEIYYNMRPTNIFKTNYLYSKLLKDAENTLTIFLKRYPPLYNMYIRKNQDNGEEFLEL